MKQLVVDASNVTVNDLAAIIPQVNGLIHAAPVSMINHPGIALDPDLLRPDLWVAEIVYFPLEPELLLAARQCGCRTLDGGGRAVGQAAEAFGLFTGIQPIATECWPSGWQHSRNSRL